MNIVIEQFERAINAHTTRSDRLAVAVSGGKDSMCLLSLCLQSPLILKKNLLVISVDHKIRGNESVQDVEFVRSFCQNNNVAFLPHHVDVPLLSKQSGRSIETEARQARLAVFDKLLESGRVSRVLTAHHASDNAESILMHLFRGCGLDGLCGMKVCQNGILRPLLEVSREELDVYADARDVIYIHDKTNQDSRYTRNFIRNEVLPLIRQQYAGAEQAVLRLAAEAQTVQADIKSRMSSSAWSVKDGTVQIQISALDDPLFAPYYIKAALKKGFGIFADFEFVHLKAVAALTGLQNGTGVDLPHGLRAVREYECVTVHRRACSEETAPGQVPFAVGRTTFLGKEILVQPVACKPPFRPSKGILYFDPTKIPKTAEFRFRQDGDYFCPYGGGTRKLKEYLIDKKIPVRLRNKLICLVDGSEILAVAGVEISDKIKVEEDGPVYMLRIRE